MSTTSTPSLPAAWKAFTLSYSIPTLPYRSYLDQNADTYTERDVYVDAFSFLASKSSLISVYADIIGFNSPNTTIDIPDGGAICLYTRVLSCSSPLTLTLRPASAANSLLMVYASNVDQPVRYVMGSSAPITLDLGPKSANFGVQIALSNGAAELTYLTAYDPLQMMSPEIIRSVQTQLRIATILFWVLPDVAMAMTIHIARVTLNSRKGAILNLQANALGQQLTASALTGPRTSYAPVLTLDSYKRTLDGAINVAAAFEDQFNRFTDRKASVEDQKLAWDTMLARAQDAVTLQTTLASEASAKWLSACDTLSRAGSSLKEHQRDLKDKQLRFKVGLDTWKRHKMLEAAFEIISAVTMFAVAVGLMCIGDPATIAGAPAEAEAAIKAVSAVAEVASSATKALSSDSMEKLKDSIEATLDLMGSTTRIVEIMSKAQEDQSTEPPLLTEEKSAIGSSDMNSIATLAAWDKWTLEADQQMEFAIDEGIEGASEYRLELRKHAIDSKLVTQARAQAIKAGQEYAQLQLALQAGQADLKRLQALRTTYQGEMDKAEDARSGFYDRMMMIRTSVLVEMRKAVWAYKYLSLKESNVHLDPLKSINDLRADAHLITQEVENWQEQFSSDFSTYTPAPVMASRLSAASGAAIVASLKKSGSAMFTLTPTTTSGAGVSAISGPFTDGSHFRVQGMRAYLVGARIKTPAADGTGSVTLTISTSGLYSDIQNDEVSTFNMLPLSRSFKYGMGRGSNGDTDTSVLIDAFINNKDHVDPTPFTHWKITVKQPELLDLSNITDVKLVWQGTASFDV